MKHLLKGKRVKVRNQTISGKPIVEGYAFIKDVIIFEPDNNSAFCTVQFDDRYGDEDTNERWVFMDDIELPNDDSPTHVDK